ncbi:hypothetical protein [Variovorax sp. MHTC-1]|uniref:hypothetical protein n=1 Tax=Variovorax sp. MHTC-1 TaxID=2495593 RepID=UPI000F890F3C|nr:hypothetical protein [Variovorax sp. MHTC-1]RST50067.1 hypothetical protein EJI01_22800 [Variovorax sp. MHTC-1]
MAKPFEINHLRVCAGAEWTKWSNMERLVCTVAAVFGAKAPRNHGQLPFLSTRRRFRLRGAGNEAAEGGAGADVFYGAEVISGGAGGGEENEWVRPCASYSRNVRQRYAGPA